MANAPDLITSTEIGKKKNRKKNNTAARLKRCKLDAKREQWLSQVKNKDCKITRDNLSPPCTMSSLPQTGNTDNSALSDSIEFRQEDNLDDNYTVSSFNSPTSSPGINSSRCSSRSVNEKEVEDDDENDNDDVGGGEDNDDDGGGGGDDDNDDDNDRNEGDDGVFDNWEDVADALTANDDIQDHPKLETNVIPINQYLPNDSRDRGILKTPNRNELLLKAWRPEDAFRPRSLPSLSSNRSFSTNMNWNYILRNKNQINEAFANQPSLCPICCEELDHTDFSFLPCSCGFHLCLFCHKTIMEDTGRCPQCRKEYSPVASAENIVPDI